ncbi:MAG: FAD-binding protein [Treponema sp.]|nr:FAD-binding protein [Treponema sp.]
MKKMWLRSGVFALVLATALVFTGCPGNGNGNGDRTVRLSASVVVVGAGAAGMPAALAAADELGAYGTVILLEADGAVGGSFAMAAGGFNPHISHGGRVDGQIDLAWGAAYNGPGGTLWSANYPVIAGRFPNGDKLARIAAHATHVRDNRFLQANWNVPLSTGALPLFAHPATGLAAGNASGSLGVLSFLTAIESYNNISLMVSTRATSLITEGAGANLRVTGVNAVNAAAGRNYVITAQRVILATGGMTGNNQMLLDNLDFDIRRTNDTPYNTPGLEAMLRAGWYRGQVSRYSIGDGITMAKAIGAASTQNWWAPHAVAGFDREFYLALPTGIQPIFRGHGPWNAAMGFSDNIRDAIIVNGLGQRFANEDVAFNYGGGTFGNAIVNNALPPYHIIFTSAPQTSNAATGGLDVVAALTTAAGMGGQWSNEVLTAPTLAGLAAAMASANASLVHADFAANFAATIATYNENVRYALAGTENADATDRGGFGKPNARMVREYLDAVNGPFFAVRIYPGAISSRGGIMADWRGRVLRADDSEIANLYAVGEMSFRDLFADGNTGGTALSLGITSGYIAGTDAARMILDRGPIPSLVTDDLP